MGAPENPEVTTAAGAVRGRRENGLAVFRGIPYAQAPVDKLRFEAPQPTNHWDGVREAFAFGPPVPQDDYGTPPHRSLPAAGNWLTVNIWTPDVDPAARRPVMVWFYGGGYKFGSSDDPAYNGSRLALDGDLVVVTLNYRLGVEGFLQIEGAPANRGLLDQVAALEWVRENITAFGGDPSQVTVFGQSAGAGCVSSLMAMPRARGLFRRAIVQSAPGTFFSTELADDIAQAMAAEIGLRPTKTDLRGVNPYELPEAGSALTARMPEGESRWGAFAHTTTPFSPVVDGEVLPATPWDALAHGAGREVELIVGHNRDEYRLFMVRLDLFGKVSEDLASTTLSRFGPTPEAARVYREAFPDAGADDLFELVQSDWLFRMPSLNLAQAQTSGGGQAHLYELTWAAPAAGGAFGACHGLDVPLTFGVYDSGRGRLLIGTEPSSEAEALSAQFRASWTAFATTGDPGWPAYDAETRLTKIFDTESSVTAYPEEASRTIWAQHPFAPLTLPTKTAHNGHSHRD